MTHLLTDGHSIARFGGDSRRAAAMVTELGLNPIDDPVDLLGRGVAGMRQFFDVRSDHFGVSELYRVGSKPAPPGTVAAYVAVLASWGTRSADRDRARRRVARALVELSTDSRVLAFLVPNAEQRVLQPEAELIFPRPAEGAAGRGMITTVRALIDLRAPNRFHRDLFTELAIAEPASLSEVSQRWQRVFSVERVTKDFYQEYQRVREALANAVLPANPNHKVLNGLSADDRRAWATRQMGRVLFLWFLQSKRWLGGDGSGPGRPDYLVDLWKRRSPANGGFYRGMLVPLFFEGMARRHPGREIRELLEFTPYLNGGLFRTNALEDRIIAGGEVFLPDELFDPRRESSVLGLLSRYRFTTRESTPDDQSVDPDPELLGRVFENLYQGDERHDTGTFYTPREIVHFMCRQALDGYLRDKAHIEQSTIDRLRREVVDPERSEGPLDAEVERQVIDALESVRVCDPAVGSGAFLVGAMQEIVLLRRGLLHARGEDGQSIEDHIADWKRHAIQWSLYGVDINPEAIEICQLRLWLSLVLDLQNPLEIEPLPNLDFRIVAGDSLIDRAVGIPFAESLPRGVYQPPMEIWQRVKHDQEQIDKWRREFEATQENPERLRELRENVLRASQQLIRYHLDAELDTARAVAHAATRQAHRPARTPRETRRLEREAAAKRERQERIEAAIAGLRPDAAYQKPFLWPVAFPEVFQQGGFDVVLANPPYVRMEHINNEDERVYADCFPEVAASRADVLVYFYARALQILRPGGWLSFITSNKYMRAAYGHGARPHLLRSLCLHRVIDFGDLPLFDSDGHPIAAYPAVVIGRRGVPGSEHELAVADLTIPVRQHLSDSGRPANPENIREVLKDLDSLLTAFEIPGYPQELLGNDQWLLETPSLVRLFNRLISQGTPLAEFANRQIFRGVVTGLNEAFVVDQAKYDELVATDPKSAEILKPWLRGRDIHRWRAEWARLYIIFTSRGTDLDQYPAIKRHLAAYRHPRLDKAGRLIAKGLEPRGGREYRAANTYPWYELQQPQEGIYPQFAQSKVVFNRFIGAPTFAFDDAGFYHNDACYFVVSPTPALAALVNSRVGWWLLSHLCTPLQNGYLQVFVQFIERFPIPTLASEARSELEKLVHRLTVTPTDTAAEDRIDKVVAGLYDVSRAEEDAIRSWFESRARAYATVNLIESEDLTDDD